MYHLVHYKKKLLPPKPNNGFHRPLRQQPQLGTWDNYQEITTHSIIVLFKPHVVGLFKVMPQLLNWI